jgi:para-nitrobenzyl esterase
MLGNTLREGFDRDELSLAELKDAIRKQYGDLAERAFPLYGLDGDRLPPTDPQYGTAAIQWGTDQQHRCRVVAQGLEHSPIAPFYQFQFELGFPGSNSVSSTHAADVSYTLGLVYNPRYARVYGPADRKLADVMEAYWSNFAKAGDPNGPGLPEWRTFDADHRAYMAFRTNGAVPAEGLRRAQCDVFMDAEKARPTWEYPERGAKW